MTGKKQPEITRFTDLQIRKMFEDGLKNGEIATRTGLSEYRVYEVKKRIFGERLKVPASGEAAPTRRFPKEGPDKVIKIMRHRYRDYEKQEHISLPRVTALDGPFKGNSHG